MALAPGGIATPRPPGPPLAAAGPGGRGPTASPLATPQPAEGRERAARVNVQLATRMLQMELPNFSIESDEAKALLSVLKMLSGAFGKSEDKDRELIPAEIMQLLAAGGPGSQPPGAAAMAAKPAMPAGPIPT